MPDGFADRDWWRALYDDTVAALLLDSRDPAETAATGSRSAGPTRRNPLGTAQFRA